VSKVTKKKEKRHCTKIPKKTKDAVEKPVWPRGAQLVGCDPGMYDIPLFSLVLFLLFSLVFSCILDYSPVFCCILLYSRPFSCIGDYSLEYSRVFSCLLLYC
jgi:hypothetical protein